MMRIRTSLFLAAMAVSLLGSTVFAKPGVVMIEDGTAFVGDVTEKGDQYVIRNGENNTQINKGNVKNVKYFDSFKQEFDYRMKALPEGDAAGRAQLASMAMDRKDDELATVAATDALKIDPKNAAAKQILEALQKKQPVAPPNPEKTGPAMAEGSRKTSGKTRLVTPDEINRIRQIEWRPDDQNIRLRIDADSRHDFVTKSGMKPGDFNKLSVNDQGRTILDKGSKEARAGVHILSDPPSMQEFKTRVEKLLLQNCATSGCHDGSNKNTSFVLQVPEGAGKVSEDSATYTNFLVIQDYSVLIDKVQHDMIDRGSPNDSLLTQYILAPNAANTPHPKVEGFKGAFKSAADPRYRAVVQWAQSLPVIKPDYGINLMKPANEAKAPAKEPGKAAAPPEDLNAKSAVAPK